MAAQANVTLTDGASTPVNRLFAARGVDVINGGPLALWHYTADGTYQAYNKLTSHFRYPTVNSSLNVVTLRLVMPTLEQSSPSTSTGYQPVPKVAYEHQAELKFHLPTRGTTQEREDILVMMRDLIDEAIVLAMVQDLDPVT